MPLAGRAVEALIAVIILALMLFWLNGFLRREYAKSAPLALIILGAAGNLFDRLKYGYVIDYLDLKYFTVFNLADAMIVAGAVLLLFNINNKKAAA